MNKTLKLFTVLVCLCLLFSFSSCGGNEEAQNTTISQTAYATIFKQPTSATPVTTNEGETTVAEEATETATETEDVATETTVARTGERKFYKQSKPMRNITSKQLIEMINAGINLGSSFDNYGVGEDKETAEYETFTGNPETTKELIDKYCTSGFKAVRIPVSWTEHMNGDNTVKNDWLNRVEEVVKYVMDNGMFCIINSQNDQSWLTSNSADYGTVKQKFVAMWTSIANHFKSYNDRLLFESFGEILKADDDWSEPSSDDLKTTNKLNTAFVSAIRATGGNNKKRHLVISTYGAGVSENILDGFKIPKDSASDKLIAKVNMYVPSEFCLKSNNKSTWGKQSEKDYLASIFSVVNARFTKLGMPVLIGEYGAVSKGNDSARAAYASYFTSLAYNNYMVAFWWDDGNDFSLINRENYGENSPKIIDSIIKSAN